MESQFGKIAWKFISKRRSGSAAVESSPGYSEYTSLLHNHDDDLELDILMVCPVDGIISLLIEELRKRHVVVDIKECSDQNSDSVSQDAILCAVISEYNTAFLQELTSRFLKYKERFVPIFCGTALGMAPIQSDIIKRWKDVSAEFGLNAFTGNEEDRLKLVKGLIGLRAQHQITKVSKEIIEGLYPLLQRLKIHCYQCYILVQKMLTAELILKDVKCHFKTEAYNILRHILCLLGRGRVLIHSCTKDFWLMTALFKLESEEEFMELIKELEIYCVLLIDAVSSEDVSSTLKTLRLSMLKKPIIDISACAEKDRQCFVKDISGHKPKFHELELCNFLLHRRGNVPLKIENIQVVQNLGEGTEGMVQEIKWNDITLAKKSFKYPSKELENLAQMRHPNIVSLVGFTANDKGEEILMERMKPLEDLRKRKFRLSTHLDVILQIAKAMRWLHQRNIFHGDLKPENILINCDHPLCKHLLVKIADFGNAIVSDTSESESPGSLRYVAPETVDRKYHHHRLGKMDVYSYGKVCRYILMGEVDINWDSRVPACLAKYLNNCVAENPDERPSFEHICEVLELMKKAELIGITDAVDQAFSDYSTQNFSANNFLQFSNAEIKIIKTAALTMLQRPERKRAGMPVLRGWLVADRSITPYLFQLIPNPLFLDGTRFTLKSVMLQKYISLQKEKYLNASSDNDFEAEKFKLWRYSASKFHIRASNFKFVSASKTKVKCAHYLANTGNRLDVIAHPNINLSARRTRVQIRSSLNGRYLVAPQSGLLIWSETAEEPTWDDADPAVFEMTIIELRGGEYQLVNGYGKEDASIVLKQHWATFVTKNTFEEFAQQGISVVLIPVGWWITHFPVPFVEGSLEYLDKAFNWATEYNIKIIIGLQGPQGYRDGEDGPNFIITLNPTGFQTVQTSSHTTPLNLPGYSHGLGSKAEAFDTMNFLRKRYGNNPTLLRMQLVLDEDNWTFFDGRMIV